MSLVYSIKDGEMVSQEVVQGAAKVDIHVHSSASGYIIPYGATQWLGVRECYTKPSTIRRLTKKHHVKSRRMDLWTISDHDVIDAAEDMREHYPDEFFTSCEYTAKASKGKFVHIGINGLEFPGDLTRPLNRKEVYELHRELNSFRLKNWEKLYEYCEKVGLLYILNHPGLLMSTKKGNRLTGEEVYAMAQASKYIEINGDCQLENLVAIELAQRLNKPIVAGSDAHTPLRLGYQYTVTTVPVKTPYEFIQALKQGNVGIGSRFPVPVDNPVPSDVMMRAFNGRPALLFADSIMGHVGYLSRDYIPEKGLAGIINPVREKGVRKVFSGRDPEDYSVRKLAAGAGFFGMPIVTALVAGLGTGSLAVGLSSGLGMFGLFLGATFLVAGAITRNGKKDFAYWTRELYHDIQNYLAEHDTKYLTQLHDRLLQQAEVLEQKISMPEFKIMKETLEENRQEKLEIATSLESVIKTVKKTYTSKTLRIPHDLVGLKGWLERLVQPEYDLAERDLGKLLQEPVQQQDDLLNPEKNLSKEQVAEVIKKENP